MPRRPPRPTVSLKAYNVVRCPHCRFVQAIKKQGACKSCGKKLESARLMVLGSTNRVTEVPPLVQRIKASLASA
jgi:hypothetical protein